MKVLTLDDVLTDDELASDSDTSLKGKATRKQLSLDQVQGSGEDSSETSDSNTDSDDATFANEMKQRKLKTKTTRDSNPSSSSESDDESESSSDEQSTKKGKSRATLASDARRKMLEKRKLKRKQQARKAAESLSRNGTKTRLEEGKATSVRDSQVPESSEVKSSPVLSKDDTISLSNPAENSPGKAVFSQQLEILEPILDEHFDKADLDSEEAFTLLVKKLQATLRQSGTKLDKSGFSLYFRERLASREASSSSSSEDSSSSSNNNSSSSSEDEGSRKRVVKRKIKKRSSRKKKSNPREEFSSASEASPNLTDGGKLMHLVASASRLRRYARRLMLDTHTCQVADLDDNMLESASRILGRIEERMYDDAFSPKDPIVSLSSVKLLEHVPFKGKETIDSPKKLARYIEATALLKAMLEADALVARYGDEFDEMYRYVAACTGLCAGPASNDRICWGDLGVDFEFSIDIDRSPCLAGFRSWKGLGDEKVLYFARPACSVASILLHGLQPFPYRFSCASAGRGLNLFETPEAAVAFVRERSQLSEEPVFIFAAQVAFGKSVNAETVNDWEARLFRENNHSINLSFDDHSRVIVRDASQVLPFALGRVAI